MDEHIPQLTLGWRLQMALAHAGVSVQEMAGGLGVSRSTVSRWIHDDGAPPRAAFVKQWALATGVPLVWLETGNAPARPEPDGGKWAHRGSNSEPAGLSFLRLAAVAA